MKQNILKAAFSFKKIYPGEIIAGAVIITAINFFYYPDDPGFFGSKYNPYFILIIFFSCFYGKLTGIIALLISVISIAINSVIINFNSDFIHHIINQYSNDIKYNSTMQFIFLSFLFSIVLGEIRDSLGTVIQKHKNQSKSLLEKNNKLEHELNAISIVNEEYQDRILGQQNSLISLYSTMVALNSLDLEKIYPNILKAVIKFSGAIKCSLWHHNRDEKILELMATIGWDKSESPAKVPDTDSIPGWVARNNEMFSVKMLQKHVNLLEIDNKQNIITIPINIDKHVWGVINIEEMPFVKYNLYSEQLILMIADLSAPVINNAMRFDEISKNGEIDTITGLPSLDEMFMAIKDEFSRALSENTKLSLVIVEIANIDELLEDFSSNDVLYLIGKLHNQMKKESKVNTMIFQYKEKYQFSIILPNMDFDGAAMFCLKMIEHNGNVEYKINDKAIHPEIIMGYSSIRSNHRSEDDLMTLAENLLMMQKI